MYIYFLPSLARVSRSSVFINSIFDLLYLKRFIIIDKKILYHSGSSFKDLGKKCFSINKIEDKKLLENILEHLR